VKTLIVILGQLGVYLVIGVIWTQVGRLGQRAGKRGYTLTFIQALALVVVTCAFAGTLVILTTHTTADRLGGLAVFAVGAGAGLGIWALWHRVPAPDAPGTTESFSVSIAAGDREPWPTFVRARGSIRVDPPERELVRARIWLIGGTDPIPSDTFLLTDRRLVVRSAGQQLEIPRSLLRTISYNTRRDRIAIDYATQADTERIEMIVPQWIASGSPFSRTRRLYQALQTGLLNPKSISEPLQIVPPAHARSWLIAGTLFAALGIFAIAFLVNHYLGLRAAAQRYDQAPMCGSAGTVLCRARQSAWVLETGGGRHPDGASGGKLWIEVRTEDGAVWFADLPKSLSVIPPSGERISIEVWQGGISLVTVRGDTQPTYDNPDWTATNYLILVGMAAGMLAIVLGLFAAAAWRDLKRERPQPLAQVA